MTAYKVPVSRRLLGVLDLDALKRALTMLVGRHEPAANSV